MNEGNGIMNIYADLARVIQMKISVQPNALIMPTVFFNSPISRTSRQIWRLHLPQVDCENAKASDSKNERARGDKRGLAKLGFKRINGTL